jgi:tetratricopeptide (TPR) repeat protein
MMRNTKFLIILIALVFVGVYLMPSHNKSNIAKHSKINIIHETPKIKEPLKDNNHNYVMPVLISPPDFSNSDYTQIEIENYLAQCPHPEYKAIEFGKHLYYNGSIDSGIDIIRNYLLDNPKSISALMELGNLYNDAGRLNEFELVYEIILSKVPDNLETFIALSDFFSTNSDLDKARSILDKGITLNPDNIRFRYALGNLLEASGLYTEAIDNYMVVLEKDKSAEAYFKIGEAYLNLGDKEKALKYFETSSNLSKDFALIIDELIISSK